MPAPRVVANGAMRLGRAAASLVRGLAASVATVVVVVSIVFFAIRLLPGDPTSLVLGDQASALDRAALRHAWGLDRPLAAQYVRFLVELAHGRIGASMRDAHVDALALVARALPPTVALSSVGVVLGAAIGVSLATTATALRHRALGRMAARALAVGASMPLLAVAPVATWLLAVRWRIVPLPADPDAGFTGVVFAGALLALPLSASVGRVTMASLASVARAQFLVAARAKGRSALAVWIVHALPACAGPIVTVVAAQLGALLGGAIVLERMLEREGLGTVLASAMASRDLPVVEACVVASTVLFVVAQRAGSGLHAAIDPRARGSRGSRR